MSNTRSTHDRRSCYNDRRSCYNDRRSVDDRSTLDMIAVINDHGRMIGDQEGQDVFGRPLGFQWFAGGERGQYAFPSCSVSKSGSMTFNREAVRLLGDPEAVRLGWDPDNHRIGVLASASGEPGALRMRPSKKASGEDTGNRSVLAKAFLLHFGILPSENNRFRLESVRNDALALDLEQPLPKSKTPAKKRPAARSEPSDFG